MLVDFALGIAYDFQLSQPAELDGRPNVVNVDVVYRQRSALLEVVHQGFKHAELAAVLVIELDYHVVLLQFVGVQLVVLFEQLINFGDFHDFI
jgi:hypothetical protein